MSTTGTKPSLYERLGGEAALEAAVVVFYSKVVSDALVMPFFQGVDMDALIKKLIAFLKMAFGGRHDYGARALREAHIELVHRGLDDRHFDRVAALLAESLRDLDVGESLVSEVLAIVEATRDDVLCR